MAQFCMSDCRDTSSPPEIFGTEAQVAFAEKLTDRLLPVVKQIVLQLLTQDPVSDFVTQPGSEHIPLQVPSAPAVRSDGSYLTPRKPDSLGLLETTLPEDVTVDVHSANDANKVASPGAEPIKSIRSGAKKASLTNMKSGFMNSYDIDFKGADYVKLTGDEIRAAEAVDLHLKFKQLEHNESGLVHLEALFPKGDADEDSHQSFLKTIQVAVVALNSSLGDLHEGEPHHLSLETFKVVMLAEHTEMKRKVGEDNAHMILHVRERCIKGRVNEQIAALCGVDSREMNDTNALHASTARTTFGVTYSCRIPEPIAAIVILVNALTIGISLDNSPDWVGWDYVEGFFTIFFTTELIVKLSGAGCFIFFVGEDWAWNWLDTVIVLLALLDTSITIIDTITSISIFNFASFTVFRLFRLVRVLRIVRLLRLKMFKELSLMLNGVVGGLRTLFWAIVMLLVIVYALGIVLRQIMDPDNHYCNVDQSDCNRGEKLIDEFGHLMFQTVPRSMVTMFLCLTEGCNAPDGTPLLWHLWDTRGPWLVIGYLLVYLFVTFGIFNLIVGIFVESVLDFARSDAQLRTSRRHQKHLELARQLRSLLFKICSMTEDRMISEREHEKGGLVRSIDGIMKKIGLRQSSTKHHVESDDEQYLTMRVSKEIFDAAMDSDDVQNLLEDLEVSMASRENLFQILDADSNGYVAITELIDGILTLRGPADKGDTVSTVLMTRNLLRHVKKFEEAVLHNQSEMKHLISKQAEEWQAAPSTRANDTALSRSV